MTPAEMLKRALAGTQRHRPEPITDEFALAIAKRLESRGIARVPGLPEEEVDWPKQVLAFLQEQRDIEERAAQRQRQAEQEREAPPAPKTTAGILRDAIAGSSGVLPLNGEAVLRAALAGLGTEGTINGRNE